MELSLPVLQRFPLTFEISGLPPSVNHTYSRGWNGRVFKNSKSRAWEEMAKLKIKTAAKLLYGSYDLSAFSHEPLEFTFSFYRPTWKGKSKEASKRFVRKDLDNLQKILCDAICTSLGLDDAAVVRIVAEKKTDPKGLERTKATLRFS